MNISLETRTGSGGDAQGDVLRSIEDVIGSKQADFIIGSGVSNDLSGVKFLSRQQIQPGVVVANSRAIVWCAFR